MVKLQACEPTHVVTEQKYEQGKRGGADVGRKAEKCHFMPSDHLTARSPGGPLGAQSGCCRSPSDRWAADGSGGGRRQVLLSPFISIWRRRASSRHPIPPETSSTFFAIISNDGSLVEVGSGEGGGEMSLYADDAWTRKGEKPWHVLPSFGHQTGPPCNRGVNEFSPSSTGY